MLKHLTLNDRITIQNLLKEGRSFKEIGRQLDKDCTTIAKEIKKHLIVEKTGCFGQSYNACILRFDCCKKRLCDNPVCTTRKCRNCSLCNNYCNEFIEQKCSRILKPPYVCNGCDNKSKCTLKKTIYRATKAHEKYEQTLSESRSGLIINETELKHLDDIVSPLVKKGQSIHHICTHNADKIMFSEKTIYNYVDANLLSAINLDMPRKVRYKPRKKPGNTLKVDKKCRIDRTYEDFLSFMQQHGNLPVVEMDTVEGKKGGKVLLTIHFTELQFMLAFLRDTNDSQSVIDAFNYLYNLLGKETFKKLFHLILTDNGTEFSNPCAIEFDKNGGRRTYVFYCDPYSSYQKPEIENNHEFIRRILPKGTSFNGLDQSKIELIMNHINSYGRENLNDKSPYEMFEFVNGKEILDVLGVRHIPPNDINLTPSLIR